MNHDKIMQFDAAMIKYQNLLDRVNEQTKELNKNEKELISLRDKASALEKNETNLSENLKKYQFENRLLKEVIQTSSGKKAENEPQKHNDGIFKKLFSGSKKEPPKPEEANTDFDNTEKAYYVCWVLKSKNTDYRCEYIDDGIYRIIVASSNLFELNAACDEFENSKNKPPIKRRSLNTISRQIKAMNESAKQRAEAEAKEKEARDLSMDNDSASERILKKTKSEMQKRIREREILEQEKAENVRRMRNNAALNKKRQQKKNDFER
ncbi:MAG: hypothetical protein LUC92_03445 [Clostridiales bacterium]|nr:hypothetical protein [Clostridiales bacterium]